MSEPDFHPAECCPKHCNDRDCPYTHYDTWEVGGVHYISRRDAIAALPPAERADAEKTGASQSPVEN